jgi:DNA-binding MarR family transcriptional regulator
MPEPSSSHQHVANVLGALSLVVADHMSSAIEAVAALGPSASAALAALHEFLDGGSMTQLRSVLGLTHSGTVRLVDRLVAEGLVDRGRSADGRAVSIVLTQRGRRLAAQVLRARRISLDGALSELTAADVRDLSRVLDKMLTTIALTRAKGRSAPTPGRPQPWLCRLCEFDVCGRSEDNCPVNNAVTTSARS